MRPIGGSSLKDLIREGCYSAKITLHLDNSKYGAYQQGTFGNEIIVERTIKRDGPASFSLKSENGKRLAVRKRISKLWLTIFLFL